MGTRLWIWLMFLGLPVWAWGEDITTLGGQTYSNVTVLRYDQKGIFIQHDAGTNKVAFKEILPELRDYYKKISRSLLLNPEKSDAADEPAGPDDLVTRNGQIYRNVIVRSVEPYAVVFSHEAGSAKVYFSEIPDKTMRDKYRTAAPVPFEPAGSNDLVTADGQIFRNVRVDREEPDGLTFRHDGGVTKLQFPALPEDLQKQYKYDYQAAMKYRRDMTAQKKREQEEAAARSGQGGDVKEPVAVFDASGTALPNGEYWVRFTVRNLTAQLQTIRVIPYDYKDLPIAGGKKIKIPANGSGDGQKVEIQVPLTKPIKLLVICGSFQVSRTIKWN